MKNECETSNERRIQDILEKLRKKSKGGGYIFRGENKCHPRVSSSLYREFDIEDDNFDIELVEKEMLNDAKKHVGELPQVSSAEDTEDPENTEIPIDLERLTELQHYSGKTNLIDFTTDYLVALFFACDGKPEKHGRVILQKIEKIKDQIYQPQNPRHRVIAQKSIFVRPPHGFFCPDEEKEVVRIEKDLKQDVLSYLRNYHGISTYTIYNDLQGFITHQDRHGAAYTCFYRGLACQNHADSAKDHAEKQDLYRKAIEHYTNAIKSNPEYVDAYYSRGNIYLKIDKFPEAIENYNQAIALDPEYVDAYYSRGNIYLKIDKFPEAIENYNQAIALNPKHADAYHSRGKAYYHKGDIHEYDFDKAIENYNQAIALDPEYVDAYYSRGNIYLKINEIPEAIENYNQAIALNPKHADAYHSRGKAYYHKGDIHEYDFDKAIENYNQAIALDPEYVDAYYSRGKVYLSQEEWEKAKTDLITAKNMGVDIAASFHSDEESVEAFEAKHEVQVPEDIAALLR